MAVREVRSTHCYFSRDFPGIPKCPLELVQDFILVTKATTSKTQEARKIPNNELTVNLQNFARRRSSDRHFCKAVVQTSVQRKTFWF